MNWKKLVDVLKGHKVYIQTHNFPDPDALSSALGMQTFLKAFQIDATICYAGKIDKNSTKRMVEAFQIPAIHIDKIQDMQEQDYIITIDAQKYNSNLNDFIGTIVVCIDHHPTYVPSDYLYSDIRICGSCASIITSYFIESNVTLDKNTATALLYGLKMDTDSFNRGVTNFDIDMFSYLYKIADNHVIRMLNSNNMEIEDLHAYGEAIRNIKIYDNVGFARIDFECPQALVAMISDFILGLDVVRISVVYAVESSGFKFSVRNEDEYCHAGIITQKSLKMLGGDGGGHYFMAGGILPKTAAYKIEDRSFDYIVRETFLEVISEARMHSEH